MGKKNVHRVSDRDSSKSRRDCLSHEPPIAIERAEFFASVNSTASQALVADARRLLDSAQFPPPDPPDLAG